MTNEQEREELDAEAGAVYGDPRRCPKHGRVTSSPDGMFDGLCGACESEMDKMDAYPTLQRKEPERLRPEMVASDDIPF